MVLIIVGNGYGVLFNNSIEMKFPVILNGAVAIFIFLCNCTVL